MPSFTPQQQLDSDGPHSVILGEEDHILCLEYIPDGRVVTGSRNGTVRVRNVESGKQEGSSMEHEKKVVHLAVTRDGAKIISSGWNGRIKVWDVESHKLLKEWTHPEIYPIFAVSPDDRFIAVGGWNVTIYALERNRTIPGAIRVGGVEYTSSVCFSPDGNKLACGTLNKVRVYDVSRGTLLLAIHRTLRDCELVTDVLWSRDGSELFSASAEGTVHCWNSGTGRQIGHSWIGHTDAIPSITLSPDGLILASASWDKTIRFWNATTGDPIGQCRQHEERVHAVRFSPSGGFVASIGKDGNIYIWRVVERLGQCQRSNFKYVFPVACSAMISYGFFVWIGFVSPNFPPPPDLTPYIVKADDHYVAGGAFGDVYRCWYRDGLPKEVRIWCKTHAACDLLHHQVAVKAFRFKFAMDGDASRSTKVTRLIHRQYMQSKVPRRCSVESLEFGGDSITSM